MRGKLFSIGLYLCICSVSFGGSYWPERAVLYLYKPGVSVWLRAGRRRGAVGAEAALGKRGLSTGPGTSAQGVDRWQAPLQVGWGGRGCRCVCLFHKGKKKKMDEMVSFPLSSFFFF